MLWHPYGPLTGPTPREVIGADGVCLALREAEGTKRRVIDAMSSWWYQIHGYRHPALDAAAHAQLESFAHVMFGGLTHAPAVELAERLVAISPNGLDHVF
nr:aminotransferase class III-fold pyridoxal phosphate-dependent enzyme [Bowdeniella nasicola]